MAGRQPAGRWRGLVAAALTIAMAVIAPAPALGAPGSGSGIAASVKGSPFSPDGDGIRETARFRVTLAAEGHLKVTVVDFDGAVVRTLMPLGSAGAGTHEFPWDGRSDVGSLVPDGPYRFRAAAGDEAAADVVELPVTKALLVPYARSPGVITVAIDPGHGGTRPGAVASDGTREAELNLDESLRLAAMLRGAGIDVVMTRTTDVDVNEPAWDRNGDGQIEYWDELAARVDTATLARPDVFLSIHNNLAVDPRVGGPATLYSPNRPFSGESLRLAELVQRAMLATLRGYRTPGWKPFDHGVVKYPYFILSEVKPTIRLRASLMPGVLSEGMFMSQPYELELLHRADVRQAMAVAYFSAISQYLNTRAYSVGFTPLDGPTEALEGTTLRYSVSLTNRGNKTLTGWRLTAAAVTAVPLFDGTGAPGTLLGRIPIPPLAPGRSVTVAVDVPAPAVGDWLLKFDVRRPGSRPLSARGNVPLQLPLSVAAPESPP
jgi:N-acetylmuramoyl-L-alanine amidase